MDKLVTGELVQFENYPTARIFKHIFPFSHALCIASSPRFAEHTVNDFKLLCALLFPVLSLLRFKGVIHTLCYAFFDNFLLLPS